MESQAREELVVAQAQTGPAPCCLASQREGQRRIDLANGGGERAHRPRALSQRGVGQGASDARSAWIAARPFWNGPRSRSMGVPARRSNRRQPRDGGGLTPERIALV